MNLTFNLSFPSTAAKPAAKKQGPAFGSSGDYLDKALSSRVEAQIKAWDEARLKKLQEQSQPPAATVSLPVAKPLPSK